MKIFIKNEIIRKDIELRLKTIECFVSKKTDNAIKDMVELLNNEMKKLGFIDKILNFFGCSKVRKQPITENEVKTYIDENILNCCKLYAILNIRTKLITEKQSWYFRSIAYKQMFPNSYLKKISDLKVLLEMTFLNNHLFCEINEEDYRLIYGKA